MRIDYKLINKDLSFNKKQIQEILSPQTHKLDTAGFSTTILPIIPVAIAKNLILQNNRLDKCIRVLSQDVVLNDFSFLSENKDENLDKKVLKFWQENKDEFYRQVQEYYGYGFGASEVVFDEDGFPAKLYQIPAETLFISQEPKRDGSDGYSYYAVQHVNGQTTKMKLSRFNYDEEDDDLPTCFWLGNGKTSNFYEIPYWVSAFNSISAKVALDSLNAKKINEGNLLSGILTIVSPPLKKNDESPEESLKDQMEDAGTGILTLHLKQYDEDVPLTVQYIPITESNYDYLSNLAKECDQDVLACYCIPEVRLMVDNITESMNSHRTERMYEIYTKSLDTEQSQFEKEINRFNRKFFGYNGLCDIEIPIFTDKKETEVKAILELFNNGILTLGETINAVKPYYPKLELNYEENNPLFKERYYNGRILGFNTGNANPLSLGDMDEIIRQF